nr:hypothetical protein [Tanacetum cinerariifolium]
PFNKFTANKDNNFNEKVNTVRGNITIVETRAVVSDDQGNQAKNINEEAHIHARVDGKKVIISEATIKKDLKFEDEGGVDCLSNEVIFEQLPLMCSTMASAIICLATRQKFNFSKYIFDSMVKHLDSGTKFLMYPRVESSAEEQCLDEKDASKQERNIVDIDADAETILVDETAEDQGRYNDQEMFDTDVLKDEEVVVKDITATTTIVVSIDDITLARALVEVKTSKPKARGIIIQEPSETPTTTTIPVSLKVQDKEKGIMVEEPLKMEKRSNQFYEQEARRLQAKIDEQDMVVEEKEKAQLVEDENLAWDNVQAMMDADYELAAKLQEEEQGEAEEKRRKPPTKAQKRNQVCVYLKNMVGFTHNQLKNKSFDEVQKAFDKTMSWINSFVPMESEVVKDKVVLTQESSSKRATDKLDQGRSKKQKVEDDKELKRCLEIILDDGDDVTVYATLLSIKTLIINYKIYKEGKKSYFQIFRADGNSQMHYTFSKMLKNFNREDLKVLWRLVKDRFVKSKLVDDMDSFLLHTLKTMFEHHVEDTV